MAEDDELAAELAGEQFPRRLPPLSEWSPEVEVLAVVADRLAEVANTIIGVNGGKPSRVQPMPRPVTAIDRARARLRREAADELERRLFPDRG